MCKHILNAQVSIRSPCCRKWFDCAQCHSESEDHGLAKRDEMTFACKKCQKCFRRSVAEFYHGDDDSAEYCPFCDNHFVLPAVTETRNGRVQEEETTVVEEKTQFDVRMVKLKEVAGLDELLEMDSTERLG